jgi:hypothetical protein
MTGNTQHLYDGGCECPPFPPLHSGSDDDVVPFQAVSLFKRAQVAGIKPRRTFRFFEHFFILKKRFKKERGDFSLIPVHSLGQNSITDCIAAPAIS